MNTMEASDERLDPLMNFAIKSFRLDPEKWQLSVSNEDNLVKVNGFFTVVDHRCLFICEEEEDITEAHRPPPVKTVAETVPEAASKTTQDDPPSVALPVPLHFTLCFPRNVSSKVLCVIKPNREELTKDTVKNLVFVEIPGNDALGLVTALTEMALSLIGNVKKCSDWPKEMSEKLLREMELLIKRSSVVKAQTQGHTFLPLPGLKKDTYNLERDLCLKQDQEDQTADNTGNITLSSTNQLELLNACDKTIIEWAKLIDEFLKQDSSELLLVQTRPLPEEEFNFWESRVQNLVFINKQLKSTKAQQVAAIVENAQSVYTTTLQEICSNVQSALKEAEDINHNLKPLQELLESLQTMDYPQLQDQVETVMEEVLLLWTRSQFYCKPRRIVVLLQEICNLFIELSRSFLGQDQVFKGLVLDAAPVLESVYLCIATLERLKECFRRCRAELDTQGGNNPKWDFASSLIFVHLDQFLERLEKIREVYSITQDMSHLDQAIFSGINGKKWTRLVQEAYNHFLHHITILAESKCDAADSNDQQFPELWAQFQSQVQDTESRLVTVFRSALETCTISTSAGKIVLMFEAVLRRPFILNKVHRQFNSVWNMILTEVNQTEHLVQSQIKAYKQGQVPSQVYSGYISREISILIWAQQLEQRVQHSYHNQLLIQAVELSGAEKVSEKCQSLMKLIQNFRASVRTQCTKRLDKDCAFILQQRVIQLQQNGILEVPCGPKLVTVLRELRFFKQDQEMTLGPQASHLFSCSDDITETHLSLSRLLLCYNQVVSSVDPVERPLIQAQLQDLNRDLSRLESQSWGAQELLQEVQTQRDKVFSFHQIITEARAKTAAIKQITERWGKIQLLQRQEDGLLTGGATEASQSQLSQDAQELLRLTQENMSLYRVEEGSEDWLSYLDHIDDLVHSGLVQLLQTALSFLSESMNSPGPPLLSVTLVLQPQGSCFVSSDLYAAGAILSLEQRLQSIVSELYHTSDLIPRVSARCDTNYQPILKQCSTLNALEQKVGSNAQEVSEKVEHLRAELDQKYSHLWTRPDVMREFLTYRQQLEPDERDMYEVPHTLKEFRKLQDIRSSLTAISDITVLRGWLQVNLQPFRDSVMSLTDEWSHMFTEHLLQKAEDSLQKVALEREDQPESSFPLTDTLLFLEMSGVELPPSLSAHIHC